jgi:hypothetical protein
VSESEAAITFRCGGGTQLSVTNDPFLSSRYRSRID